MKDDQRLAPRSPRRGLISLAHQRLVELVRRRLAEANARARELAARTRETYGLYLLFTRRYPEDDLPESHKPAPRDGD